MKNPLTGFLCACLLVAAGNVPTRAQEKKPDTQSVEAAAPVTDTAQPPAAPVDQTPPAPQTQPPQTAAPQQTPPAGQPVPAGQTPVPPPTEDQPQPHSLIPQPPPPPPKVPDVRRPGESGFWIGLEGWIPREQPIFNGGKQSTATTSTFFPYQGKPKAAESVEAGLAVGLHNTLKVIYTDFRASGDYTTPVAVTAFTQAYTAGTYLSTNYHVQNVKLSYEYLTWPYPVGSRKVRLKTLWQVQFTNVSSIFDSPLDYYDTNGNLILDSSGNPVNLAASGTKHIISPMFGLGLSYYPSRHFRLEASGSGFGLPHHYYIWDSEVSMNYRVLGHFEIRAGGRGFGFKTSTNADYYIKGNFASAFVGLRWYSNSE